MTSDSSASHSWKFFRLGGLDQAKIETGADLLALKHLDQKLWVALSCPVKGLELDERTLALIDSDNDGRIRVPEILAAIDWAQPRLKDVGRLLTASDQLALTAIDATTPEGKTTLASVKTILANLGTPDADTVSLADAADTVKLFAATKLNGDGVVIPESTSDTALAQLIGEIVATVGGTPDRSGKTGADAAKVDAFYAAAQAHLDWAAAGASPDVKPFGDDTAAAAAAIGAVQAKVDDFFTRTRIAAFDSRAANALNRAESDYIALSAQDLTLSTPEIAALPLATVAAGKALPLLDGVNPAWAAGLAKLHATAVTAAHGADKTTLTEAEWNALKARVAAFNSWQSSKAGSAVEALGLDRLKAIVTDSKRAALDALISADKALEGDFNAIASVEKLIRFQRDFRTLLNNFVNFTDFYSPDRSATFQAGTLFLDSRSTELCVEVAGPSPLAAMSKAFIAYCDCTRTGGAKMKIAACFTQGDSDYLFVGRNGVFYDRKGRDWDAKITAVVENPISVRQAFWLPYKKFIRKIEETVAKRAAAAEAASDAKMAAAADKTATVDQAKAAPPEAKKVDVGTVAAIGVAATAAVSTIALLLGYVFGLAAWQYPLVLLGIMLVISGPSMLIAWLKLRQRTLGPILEANGWAINGRVKINVPFGTRLTEKARIPAGARRTLDDPYADKAAQRRKVLFWLGLIVVVAAGIFVHREYYNDGRFFWQPAPEPVPAAAPPAAAEAATPTTADSAG